MSELAKFATNAIAAQIFGILIGIHASIETTSTDLKKIVWGLEELHILHETENVLLQDMAHDLREVTALLERINRQLDHSVKATRWLRSDVHRLQQKLDKHASEKSESLRKIESEIGYLLRCERAREKAEEENCVRRGE